MRVSGAYPARRVSTSEARRSDRGLHGQLDLRYESRAGRSFVDFLL